MISALGNERVLLGSPGAAAIPHEGALRYVITSRREQPTTLGELDGERSERVGEIVEVFERAGFPSSTGAHYPVGGASAIAAGLAKPSAYPRARVKRFGLSLIHI